jgi:hypothetical protein
MKTTQISVRPPPVPTEIRPAHLPTSVKSITISPNLFGSEFSSTDRIHSHVPTSGQTPLTVKDFDARRPDGSSRCWVSQLWPTHGGSRSRKSGYQQHFRTVHSSFRMTPHMLGYPRCRFKVTVSIPSTSQAKWRSGAHCTPNYTAYKICPTTRRGLFPGTRKRFLSSTKRPVQLWD